MKMSKRIMGVALASTMVLGATSSFAAFPTETVVVNENAYSFDYFNANINAVLEVGDAINAENPVYVKYGSEESPLYLDVVSGAFAAAEDMPAVTYYDADGNTTNYAAGDGEEVEAGFAATVANEIMSDGEDTYYLQVTFNEALGEDVTNKDITTGILAPYGDEVDEDGFPLHLYVNGEAGKANVSDFEWVLDGETPVVNLILKNAAAIKDGDKLEFAFNENVVNADEEALSTSDMGILSVTGAPADTTGPVIAYEGTGSVEVMVGEEFTAPQLTVTDNVDEALVAEVTIEDAEGNAVDSVDTEAEGTFTITYTAVDTAGNEATPVVITVNVVAELSVVVENVSATTEEGVTTVTADVLNAEEEATATVEIYANGDTTVEPAAANADVPIVDGAISTTFEDLPEGTHTAMVTVGDISEEADFTVEAPVVGELVVESVSAMNETVTVTLAEAAEAVTAEDFTVTQAIDGADATAVEVVGEPVLSEDGLTVTLTVAEVAQTEAEQSVVYTVNEVAAEAFTVEAEDTTDPVVTGVADGDVTNAAVTPASEEEGLTVTLTKDEVAVAEYALGTEITEEGVYVLTVADAAGNEAVVNFTIDMTAPELSVMTTGDTPEAVGETVQLTGEETTFSFTATSEEGATVVVNDGEADLEAVEGVYTVDAGKTVTVTATDVAGNSSAVTSFEVLAVVPAVEISSVSAINATKEATVTFAEGVELTEEGLAGKTMTFTLDDTAVTATYKAESLAGQTAVFALDAETLTEGTYTVTSEELTVAEGTTAAYDVTAPAIAAEGNVVTDYQTLTVAFDEAVEGTPVVTVDGVAAEATLAEDGMSMTVVDTDGFAAGDLEVVVNGLSDLAGNAMDADATVTITKDASYVADFAVTTKSVQAVASHKIYFTVTDQYGEDITSDLGANTLDDNFTFEGTMGELPLTVSYTKDQTPGHDYVTITETLVEDTTVTITLTNTVETVEYEETTTFTVQAADTAAASEVTEITSSATAYQAGDNDITLTAEILDQYGNPYTLQAGEQLRWTTSDASVVILDNDDNDTSDGAFTDGLATENTMKIDAVGLGTATIKVFLPGETTAAKTLEITVTDGELNTIDASNVAVAGLAVENNATLTEANVAINDDTAPEYITFQNANGSNLPLLASNVTFEVVEKGTTTDASGEVTIEKVTNDSGYLTGLKVVTNRTEQQTEAVENNPVKEYTVTIASGDISDTFEIDSSIDTVVDTIEVETLAENALTDNSNTTTQKVYFKNQYGEYLDIAMANATITASGNVVITKSENSNIFDTLTFDTRGAVEAGTKSVFITSGDASLSYSVTVVEESALSTINMGGTVSVINNDTEGLAADDLQVVDTGDAYVLLPATFQDQYGNEISINAGALSINGIDGNYLAKFFKADKTAAAAGEAVAYVGFAAKGLTAIPETTTTLTVTDGGDPAVEADVKVTVLEDRKVDTFTVNDFANSVLVGGTAMVDVSELTAVDQYGVDFDLASALVDGTDAAKGYTLVAEGEDGNAAFSVGVHNGDDDIVFTADAEGSEQFTVTLTYNGLVGADATDDEVIGTVTYDMTATTNNSIATLTLDPVQELNINADNTKVADRYDQATITFTAENADGQEVALDATDIDWFTSDAAVATVDANGLVTAVAKGTATITALTTNGTEATVDVTVVDDALALDSVQFVDDLTTEVEIGSTLNIGTAGTDFKFYDQNGVEILVATIDDYTTNLMDYTFTSADESIATVDPDTGVITPVAEGTVTIRVMLKDDTTGNALGIYDTVTITVVPAP